MRQDVPGTSDPEYCLLVSGELFPRRSERFELGHGLATCALKYGSYRRCKLSCAAGTLAPSGGASVIHKLILNLPPAAIVRFFVAP